MTNSGLTTAKDIAERRLESLLDRRRIVNDTLIALQAERQRLDQQIERLVSGLAS